MIPIKREWLLFSGVLLLTLAAALGILRWFAPQLIGLPADLRLVRVSEKVPPFYEGVFRRPDYLSADFLLKDPVTVIRGRPGFPELRGQGPHDVLGFRNLEVPLYADVVVLGDSQTYGSGVALEDNWPSLLGARLEERRTNVYNMATGGWGGAQYLEMATKATAFHPQLIIVAFYSGNDALDSFRVAYGMDRFADLRPRAELDAADAPTAKFPPPPESLWPVVFDDGVQAVFTPALRLVANDDHPAVEAGYAVMAGAAREIRRVTRPFDTALIFTIIPTKEYVYAEKVRRASLEPPPEYLRLVAAEGERIRTLAGALRQIPDSNYVDLTAPLSAAALDGAGLYQSTGNGHPVAAGHAVIADTLAKAARDKLTNRPRGVVAIPVENNDGVLYLVKDNGVWRIPGLELALRNGWTRKQIRIVSFRAIAGLPRRGVVDAVDPARFGPQSVR